MSPSNTDKPNDPLGIVGAVVAEKYEIVALAGEGGFSVVYEATHLIWQQRVAIKFFVLLENADPKVRERLLDDFIREGKLMSELSSRSATIVQARDIGKLQRDDGWIPYMVLEWLDGTALDAQLNSERLARKPARSLDAALSLLAPVASALELAHRMNIAHRDLKPANIMVMAGGAQSGASCKLLDFGIAKVMGEQLEHQQQLHMTGQQITAFTPNYGAPEQFSRQYGATGPWTDVFAMALIVIEVLRGGERALAGQTFFELGVASSHPVRPTPRTFGIDVSDEIEAVFARALAIDPGERYATMGEFWLALERVVWPSGSRAQLGAAAGTLANGQGGASRGSVSPSELSVSAIPIHLRPHSLPTPQGSSFPTNSDEPPRAKSGTGFAMKAGAALVVLGVFGAGVHFGMRGRDQTNAASSAPSASAAAVAASATSSASASTEYDGPCPRGMKPVVGGTFTMGSDDPSFPLWKPAHKVTLDTFCLDVNEVTVAAFRGCVDAHGCKAPSAKTNFPKSDSESVEEHDALLRATSELCNWAAAKREEHPINCVTWHESKAYCDWRGFRLPTEAEWELAARGTDGRKFPWGDDVGDHTYMNAAGLEWRKWHAEKSLPAPGGLMYEKDDGFVGTAPVGRFPRAQTQSGQLDMVGNVWEWTSDWYALYRPEPQTNPKGPGAGDRKAIRGGGFNGEFATWINPAARYHQLATARVHAIGFRCAAAVKPAD